MLPASSRDARDPRLDVFRGLAMVIILIAHIPSNTWAEWIPARFGLSDATEIFVFCSGYASALAYGRGFDREGFAAGAWRIFARTRLIYLAHLAIVAALVGTLALAEIAGAPEVLRSRLALGAVLDAPASRLAETLLLLHVPNAFDILPMYIVVLALVPAMMALARFGRGPVLAAMLGLWALAAVRWLELPADLATGRPWFFNPFGWQFLFFLGFGFARGWWRAPAARPVALAIAIAALALAAPVSCHGGWACHAGWGYAPALVEVHAALLPFADKTSLGPLRVGHFLALAFVAVAAAGEGGARLRRRPFAALALIGRQTLATFLSGLWLAQVLGLALDFAGRDMVSIGVANMGGILALTIVAAVVERAKAGASAPVLAFARIPSRRRSP